MQIHQVWYCKFLFIYIGISTHGTNLLRTTIYKNKV